MLVVDAIGRDRHTRTMRTRGQSGRTRSVVIVAFPGIQALDVVGPFEVFVGFAKAFFLPFCLYLRLFRSFNFFASSGG